MSAYRTVEGDAVDLIAWRVYDRSAGMAEAILAANPGLADLGPVLPAGLVITLPPAPSFTETRTTRLWD